MLVIKAVCKCIDVSDINAKVLKRRSVKVPMIEAVRRCPDVSNVRVLYSARAYALERRSAKAHVAGAMRS